jgi:hypothetical protein
MIDRHRGSTQHHGNCHVKHRGTVGAVWMAKLGGLRCGGRRGAHQDVVAWVSRITKHLAVVLAEPLDRDLALGHNVHLVDLVVGDEPPPVLRAQVATVAPHLAPEDEHLPTPGSWPTDPLHSFGYVPGNVRLCGSSTRGTSKPAALESVHPSDSVGEDDASARHREQHPQLPQPQPHHSLMTAPGVHTAAAWHWCLCGPPRPVH